MGISIFFTVTCVAAGRRIVKTNFTEGLEWFATQANYICAILNLSQHSLILGDWISIIRYMISSNLTPMTMAFKTKGPKVASRQWAGREFNPRPQLLERNISRCLREHYDFPM